MAHLYLALSLPRADCVLEDQHMAWGGGLAAAGSQVRGAEQTHMWSRPHEYCPQIHTVRAEAGRNVLHKYLMARGGLMLERCLDSGQLFVMLLLGVFPKGKRCVVEWVGAMAGRRPQPPLLLPKGGTPDTSISGQRR